MIVAAPLVSAGSTTADDHSLYIYRNLVDSQPAGSAYFDPIDAVSARSIYFSWEGEVTHTSSPDTSLPVVTASIKALTDDSPSLFSTLTLKLGPQKLAVMIGTDETPLGLGVTGTHGVLIRIDPETKRYHITVSGDGVAIGGSATTTGTLPNSTDLDLSNIGLEISFDDANSLGITHYAVHSITISKRQP